jgi:hypothetical protein
LIQKCNSNRKKILDIIKKHYWMPLQPIYIYIFKNSTQSSSSYPRLQWGFIKKEVTRLCLNLILCSSLVKGKKSVHVMVGNIVVLK